MGEVYRADDLRLGQPVALKFIIEPDRADAAWLERVYAEVRLARQISHPNVCRVYDVDEFRSGDRAEHFIAMEYIDGESLDSLLRRIGQLPEAKAAQLAQEICAGLAAIHARSVLHRDLKPANVMIDGQGHARLTDFGLAAAGGHVTGREAYAGTPGYMAPEALRGEPYTLRSDIYALGLLLFELFSGQPAYEGESLETLLKAQTDGPPPELSRVAPSTDDASERAIARCLHQNPSRRPGSAQEVAAMLPGGDPLVAALAAGQTPSPEVVAAAGVSRPLRWMTASILAAILIIGFFAAVSLNERVLLFHRVPLEKSGPVLANQAQQILATLGLNEQPADRAWSFDLYEELLHEYQADRARGDPEPAPLTSARPAAIDFWYRQHEASLTPLGPEGRITFTDPPHTAPGMVSLRLDPAGRLRELVVSRDRHAPAPGPFTGDHERAFDALFDAAGLTRTEFEPADPIRIPPIFADTRAAWTGVYPESPELEIRVEAALLDGAPVAFRIIEKRWPEASIISDDQGTSIQAIGLNLQRIVQLVSVLGALILARHNLKLRRGDQKGATKAAAFVFAASMLAWLLRAHLPGDAAAIGTMTATAAGQSLLTAVTLWIFYIALEPYVRRHWPETLISWTRVLAGRARDPVVGTSILAGIILGTYSAVAVMADHLLAEVRLGGALPFSPNRIGIDPLLGTRVSVGSLADVMAWTLSFSMGVLLSLVLLRLLLRRPVAAAAVWCAVQAVIWAFIVGADTPLTWALYVSITAAIAFVLIRYGLLAMIASGFSFYLLSGFPLTTDRWTWYADAGWFALTIIVGLTAYALFAATSQYNFHAAHLAARAAARTRQSARPSA